MKDSQGKPFGAWRSIIFSAGIAGIIGCVLIMCETSDLLRWSVPPLIFFLILVLTFPDVDKEKRGKNGRN